MYCGQFRNSSLRSCVFMMHCDSLQDSKIHRRTPRWCSTFCSLSSVCEHNTHGVHGIVNLVFRNSLRLKLDILLLLSCHWRLTCLAWLLSLSLSCCFCLPPEGRLRVMSETKSCLDQKAKLACCRQRSPGLTQPSRALLGVWDTLSQDWNMSRTRLVVLLDQVGLAAATAQGSQQQAPPQTPTRDTEWLQL